MQTMHRKFGKLLPRTADGAQVAVLLKEFDDADKMLGRLIEASTAWRDAWTDILTTQHRLVDQFQFIYNPIIGATENYVGHEPVPTPMNTLEKVGKLRDGYNDFKTDLIEEVNMVDTRIVTPAAEAKNWLQPWKKTMKKREDKKLDFERYQGKVDGMRKKKSRTEKENAALAKGEATLAQAEQDYNAADDNLKQCIPPLLAAVYSLLPNLLAAQIMIQNALLGHYYTLLHTYCQEEGFPSPPPPMAEIVSMWDADFRPVQHQIETGIACIASGKAVRQPMKLTDGTSRSVRNGYDQRRASSQSSLLLRPSVSPARSISTEPPEPPEPRAPPSPDPNSRPRISSVPSTSSLALSVPNAVTSPSSGDQGAHWPAAPRADYFARERTPSNSLAAAAASKKKPPPPPPKRIPSAQGFWVTALYDFAGQGQGDLVFREGDRIKVVKKTESTDDWWQGELKGIQGSFPANYCQAV